MANEAGHARGRTRERIIEVAKDLIAMHGPDGFQLQAVTEQLGLTPPAIYNHFKDRDDLVARISQDGARELSALLDQLPGESLSAAVRRNSRRYARFLVENPAHARIILWDMSRRGAVDWGGLADANVALRKRMQEALDEGSRTGEFRRLRLEAYLPFIYIGTAAASVWPDYEERDGKRVPRPFRRLEPEEIERLEDEVEELVVRLLAPERPGETDRYRIPGGAEIASRDHPDQP